MNLYETMYVFCRDCEAVFKIEVKREELLRGVPRGVECPYCRSTRLEEDR